MKPKKTKRKLPAGSDPELLKRMNEEAKRLLAAGAKRNAEKVARGSAAG